MQILFRQITIKDKAVVLGFFKEAADRIHSMNIDHWQYWKNPPIEKVKWVEEGIQNDEFFFVEDGDKQMLGMVRVLNEDLLYWGTQNERAKYVHSLVVKDKYNGQGLGVKILQSIEEDAKRNGCKYLRLDADSENPKLCKYYERQGYKKVGTKQLPISIYNLYEKALN